MEGAHRSLARVAFEPYEVDFKTGDFRKHGIRIRLQSQPLQVLELLVQHRGAIVTRDELKRKLWPADDFGDFDHGLNKAINKIREALSDSALHPRYIETVSRRGYRFIAAVTELQDLAEKAERGTSERAEAQVAEGQILESQVTRIHDTIEAPARAPVVPVINAPMARGKWFERKIIVLSALALFAAALFVWQLQGTRFTSSYIRSLAVLPLENLSSDTSQQYFADGMTDELITALGTINGLRVISRTSVMVYKGVHRPLPQIARELRVDAVVEGTVLRSGDQVRITAQLIRATTDEHLWAQSYQGDLRDTLQLQDDVARAIADRIRVKITSQEQALLANAKVLNPDAHDAYLRGRYFWNKRTEQGLRRAIDYFNQAIAKDPNYAQPYSGLADSYALLSDWEYNGLDPKEAYPNAKAAATKAVRLDDNLSEAHASLGLCLKLFDWNWELSRAELLRAIELNSSYASAHQWYGWSLMIGGKNDEGISELRKAEALDPLSLIISSDLADALAIAHRYRESIQQSRKTIEMDPSFAMAHYQLGQALVQLRDYGNAIRELQQAMELSRGSSLYKSQLGFVYAVSGRRDEALKILSDLKNPSLDKQPHAANVALVYAGLNEKDQAFVWLQRAYDERFNPSILLRPAFDLLRSDARFQDLLRRLALL